MRARLNDTFLRLRFRRVSSLLILILLAVALELGNVAVESASLVYTVTATVETDPVPHGGDAADDPAIWIHPTNPSLSTILGTDKASGGGIAVYDLSGTRIQFVAEGGTNNIDLRYNFMLSNQLTTIVAAANVENGSLIFYRVNPSTRTLENITQSSNGVPLEFSPYGLCMYHSPSTGKYYVFVTKSPYIGVDEGEVQQWEVLARDGKVTAQKVRAFKVGSDTEGCVADDIFGKLYIAQTRQAIWKYEAEPMSGSSRTVVDTTGTGGPLEGELEGLSLYYTSQNTGYLIVSDQSGQFVLYERGSNNPYVKSFRIGAGNGIDAVSGTDGIDVTNVNLGYSFPQGAFVAHDATNDTRNGNYTNFKIVPWNTIAASGEPSLTIDTRWDPRLVGMNTQPVPPLPTTPISEYTFTVEEDSYVSESSALSNYGEYSYIGVDGGSDPREKGYLRYTVANVSGKIIGAKLRIFSLSESAKIPSVYTTTNGWSESDITWSNSPPMTSGPIGGIGAVSGNTWIEYDVSSVVTRTGAYNFTIATDVSDGINVASRERADGTHAPQLVLEVAQQSVFLPLIGR